MLKFVEPCLPTQYKHFGQFSQFPPRLEKGEYMIIIGNHQSDLDGYDMMSLLHTEFIKRQTQSLYDNNNKNNITNNNNLNGLNKQIESNNNAKKDLKTTRHGESNNNNNQTNDTNSLVQSIKPIAFTLSHFSKISIVGSTIAKNFILLHSGIDDNELTKKIEDRIEEGYNTFLLYPEGAIHTMERDLKSRLLLSLTGYGIYLYNHRTTARRRVNQAARVVNAIARREVIEQDHIDGWLDSFFAGMRRMTSHHGAFRTTTAVACLYWTFDLCCLWATFFAFGYHMPLELLAIGYVIAYAVGTLAPTPGGLGAIEGLLFTLYVSFGVPSATALAVVLTYRVINFWLPIPPGLVSYVVTRDVRSRQAPTVDATARTP